MNGANEPVDSANMADGSIDKNAVQQKSVDDDVTQHFPINSSIQQQQIDSGGVFYSVALKEKNKKKSNGYWESQHLSASKNYFTPIETK